MHLDRNAGVLERDVVDERLVDVVDAVGLRLEEEGRRCPARDVDVGIESELLAAAGSHADAAMAGRRA
jgi:hypothetical protein